MNFYFLNQHMMKSFIYKKLISLVLVCLFALVSHGQSKITLKEFEDPSRSGYQSIVFEYEEDEPGGRGRKQNVTKEVKINDSNPYLNKLTGLQLISSNRNTQIFNKVPSDLFDNKEFLTSYAKVNYDISDCKLEMYSRVNQNQFEETGAIIIIHQASALSEMEIPMNEISSATVYNSTGQVVGNVNLPKSSNSTSITNDYEFFIANYGGIVSADGDELFTEGFYVISISNGEILYDESIDFLGTFDPPLIIEDNLIMVTASGVDQIGGPPLEKYFFIDPINRKIYRKTYLKYSKGYLKEINRDGMIFISRGEEELHGFNTHFTTEQF